MTQYNVVRGDLESPPQKVRLNSSITIDSGLRDYLSTFKTASTLEVDLLMLAAAIFAADRATPRGEREEFQDRRIELILPVVNIERLQPTTALLESLLRELSQDDWRVSFTGVSGTPGGPASDATTAGRTLLFSGGLDSLAAAIEFSAAGPSLQLVSHVTKNRDTSNAQTALVRQLNRKRKPALAHLQYFVSSAGHLHDTESSQRTRSFVFLVLAALTGVRTGHRELLYLAENGQMAIHLPLSRARIGAFSTRTAHPDALVLMQEFLRKSVHNGLRVINPYAQKTKAEVVAVIRPAFEKAILLSVSCWRTTRVRGGAKHCGECIPCYVRRIAVEFGGKDKTAYAVDPWRVSIDKQAEGTDGRRNLVDLATFVRRVETYSDDDLRAEWPTLYSKNIPFAETVSMYRRFAAEARTVLSRYPVGTLLQ